MTLGLGIKVSAARNLLLGSGLPALPPGYVFVTFAGAHLRFDGAYLVVEAQ